MTFYSIPKTVKPQVIEAVPFTPFPYQKDAYEQIKAAYGLPPVRIAISTPRGAGGFWSDQVRRAMANKYIRDEPLLPLRTILELWDREVDFFPIDCRPNESIAEDYYAF